MNKTVTLYMQGRNGNVWTPVLLKPLSMRHHKDLVTPLRKTAFQDADPVILSSPRPFLLPDFAPCLLSPEPILAAFKG